MKTKKKILTIWIVLNLVSMGSLLAPHRELNWVSYVSYSIQFLLFLLAISIFRNEPIRKNRFIFLNFAILFAFSFLFHLYNFVGTVLFVDEPFARLYINQFVSLGAYYLFLALAIVYLTVDLLFRDFTVGSKYLVALLVVGIFFSYYYYPFFLDAKYAHHTQDVLDWKTLEKPYNEFKEKFGTPPAPEALAASTEMYTWNNGEKSGVLFPERRLERVQELYPYLEGSNYLILVYKPLYMNTIYMCVVCLGFILLFFGYQYMKDPPQGAYIEKIMFLFLVFCSMEILHAWSAVKSLEWQSFADMMGIGQYVSIGILLFIALFFALRLRFITSVKGEFYESELALRPTGVTRWRDSLDNIVIDSFFNRKLLLGRLFVGSRSK
jgi:hypothetical protein